MGSITIKDPLIPGRKTKFQIRATFFGENLLSPIFEIEVPQAIRALRKSGEKIKLIKGSTQNQNEAGSTQILFNAYKKFIDPNGVRVLRLRIPSNTKLNTDDTIGLVVPNTTPASPLWVMSGSGALKRFKVIKKEQINPELIYLDIKINESEYNSISPAFTKVNGGLNALGNHYLVRIIGRNQRIRYAVSVDTDFIKRLINRGNVRDVLVFAYRQYGDRLTTEDKLRYMTVPSNTADTLVSKTPPTWEFVQQYLKNNIQINQFGQDFDISQKKNFAFFVSAVRYTSEIIYDEMDNPQTVWKGEWLQADSEGNPRWGRAVGG